MLLPHESQGVRGVGGGRRGGGAMQALAAAERPPGEDFDPDRPQRIAAQKLIVQPLLRHEIESWKPQTSWRNWGGVHTEEAAAEEMRRIEEECRQLAARAEFPLEILPLARAANDDQAAAVRDSSRADAMILYAAGANRLDPCISGKRHNILFVRHRSGPVYDWYENVSNRFLRLPGPDFEYDQYRNYEGVGVDDVVVDDYGEILWRLRAVYGLKNFLGHRALTIGKASGKGCPKAPALCREKYRMEIVEVPYAELGRRIAEARQEEHVMRAADRWASRYLAQSGVTLRTERTFVVRAFLLYKIFKDLMQEHGAQSFTIAGCMSTVMPIAATTACLALSVLQDEGRVAFCESDFASHPAGVLLRFISGKPVFMHNPTFPHQGVLTCAHCASPRRMDGREYDKVQLLTHYESDYGAAPKVDMPLGAELTLIDPDCAQVRWLGLKAKVIDNPSFSICRSQQDVRIVGDSKRLAREIRGSHWMMARGDYLAEMGYAVRKLGLDWLNLSEE